MEESRIHFYQTGTFTVGNRLLVKQRGLPIHQIFLDSS